MGEGACLLQQSPAPGVDTVEGRLKWCRRALQLEESLSLHLRSFALAWYGCAHYLRLSMDALTVS